MRAVEATASRGAQLLGHLLCHNVFDPDSPRRVLLRKGHVISADDSSTLARLGERTVHLLELGPGDVGETEAGLRLATAAAGEHLKVAGESESQVRLTADARGLLRVETGALERLHELDCVLVWTLEDRTPVELDRHVASSKIAPLAVGKDVLEEAERRAGTGLVSVRPYQPLQVAVLVRETMDSRAREKFERSILSKVSWFQAPAPKICYTGSEQAQTAVVLEELTGAGVELILVGGTGSTDPLDPVFEALHQLGGRILRLGVPAHPGSTYWLAELNSVPILGLASCGMFSQMTALDLLLPRFFSGEQVAPRMLTSLAAGGLIGRDRSHLFPPYDQSHEETAHCGPS